jgi:peptidoglycan hydrolase CwlO-like protein
MENAWTLEAGHEETAELEAAIRRIFEQIERADVRINEHQKEIEKLKQETRAMLAQLKA